MAPEDTNTPLPSDDGTSPSEGPSKEELKRALKAFKKRLKLMRLDDESRIGGGSMSSGHQSRIMAVRAPNKYPQEVWDALAAQGKIKAVGNGLYELTTI